MATDDKQQRIGWVDQVKGIGIILVVLGHMSIPEVLSHVIFSFHMPLFFLVSGYLFNEKKYSRPMSNIVMAKFSSLVWPFFTFTLFGAMLNGLFEIQYFDLQDYIMHIASSLMHAAKGMESIVTPLWFLTALFTTEVLFSQTYRYFPSRFSLAAAIAFMVITGFMNAHFWHVRIVYNMHIAFIALGLILLGWSARQWHVISKQLAFLPALLQCVAATVVTVLLALSTQRIDMRTNVYGNPIIFFLCALTGTYSVVLAAHIVQRIRFIKVFFQYCGRNALIILATHAVYPALVKTVVGDLPWRMDRLLSVVLICMTIEICRLFPSMVRLPIQTGGVQATAKV
jgi:acyltransferase